LVLGDRVVGERGIDLDRDVAVPASLLLPYRTQQVAAGGDIGAGELEKDVVAAQTAWQQLPQLRVVGVASGDRLLEDGRVGRDADDRVLTHEPRQLATLQQLPGEEVDPDRLTELGQPLQRLSVSGHESPPLRRGCDAGRR